MKTKTEIIKEAQETVKHNRYTSIAAIYLLIVSIITYHGNGQSNKISAILLICSVLCFIMRLINDGYLWHLKDDLDDIQ